MRLDRHTEVRIVDRETATRVVNNPHFLECRQINEDTYEITMRKRYVSCRMPRQVGLMVYSLAKRELLRCYYDLLDKYIPRNMFQPILTDTDSIYIALAAPSLRSAVNPDLRPEFDREVRKWMPQRLCDYHYNERQQARESGDRTADEDFSAVHKCCDDVRRFQKRTLGLWKVECEADAVIALAPKSYICFNHSTDGTEDILETVKKSHKGVQPANNPLTARDYWRVMDSMKPHYVINRGIRLDQTKKLMRTYRQEKRGLSYLYVKRKVLDDGISTLPLDL